MTDHVVIRLRLIGPMEANSAAGINILPSGRKIRALLAYVAMGAPRPTLRSRLAELLWSRSSEQQARASLRQEIFRLLDAFSQVDASLLIVTRDHLTLRPGAVWTDVGEVTRANLESPAALSLLDASLLEDLDGIDPNFDSWLQAERAILRNRGVKLAESLLQSVLGSDEAIQSAERLLAIDRLHEGAWRTLMKAYDSRGERGLAIQAYNRCHAALADTLDATPSLETQKLFDEIRDHSHSRMGPQQPQQSVSSPVRPIILQEPQGDPPFYQSETRTPQETHIGVMPFRLIGLHNDHASLAIGLADEITRALSRFRRMFIVSADSLDRFAADHRAEASIRSEFGLDFLLDSSIQRNGSKVRISLRLLDLRVNNRVVWARRSDHDTNDLLSLQDEIAAEVVAQIDPEILQIEVKRSNDRGLVNANAYYLMLRAIPLIGRLEREAFLQAGQHLAAATALEPDYAPAHAWYAYWHVFLVGQGWAEHPEAMMEKAGGLAERAIMLDPFDARSLSISGHVQAFLHRQLSEAIVLHERALTLNPNLAMAWALSAITYAYAGDPEEAEQRLKRYKKLSPLDPHAFIFDGIFGVVHLMKRDYERAVEVGRNISLLNPSFSATYKPYLAALGHLRRDQEAATVRQRLLLLEPDFTIGRFLEYNPMERTSDTMHYAEGLRLAGIPE